MNDPSVIENDPLVIENITSGYGHVTVLRDVSLRVGQGEIVALLGSNGAGKSTLLKTVVGLLHPSKGQILVDGANVASTADRAHRGEGRRPVPRGAPTVRRTVRAGQPHAGRVRSPARSSRHTGDARARLHALPDPARSEPGRWPAA